MYRTMLQTVARLRLLPLLIAWLLVAAGLPAADGPGPADAAYSPAPQAPKTVTPGDGPGIQPAIDDVSRLGGGTVYLPAGIYYIAEEIEPHSPVALVGDGIDRTIIRWAPRHPIGDFVTNDSTSGRNNIQVRDLTLDGEGRTSKDSSCCYGLRFQNVSDALVANVAADGHSKDGFHFGYILRNKVPYGVANSRLTGCRSRGNGRSGIALTHGAGNIIDTCEVSGNGRTERVAGIDLEPDQGTTVENNKIVGNRISGENVGLQLFVQYKGYGRVAGNAVCYNHLSGNGTGLYDFKGTKNIFIDNETDDNINPVTFYDTNPLVGSDHVEACQVPAVPPPGGSAPATATPTSTSVLISPSTPVLRP